ncbi:hypothetical protein QO058_30540 (plasmid) [Bosea vestrisii]|uniref:hypothetical protein n=1 Tax=Bosea vestrisii TaxID=151416 RepID=UPI0024DF4B4B|nr:hypothetical protein [Bosea vestrisii]WID99733.1 hypothetical protein QO058_30540 [Bosea vestrisii]
MTATTVNDLRERRAAVAKAMQLMACPTDTPEGQEFEALVDAIADYDMRHSVDQISAAKLEGDAGRCGIAVATTTRP